MRTYCYKVSFESGGHSEPVMASNKHQAVILAQAQRINLGLSYMDYEEPFTIE